jgi:hypothetical protein
VGAIAVAASTVVFGSVAPAHATGGGADAASGTYSFVVKVSTADRACSGVLVDPRWVLTVKSCFSSVPAVAAPPPTPTTVTVRGTLPGSSFAVTELSGHPTLNVVLAKLATAVRGVPPVAVGGAPVAGETLRAAGYGRTATEWVPGTPQVGPVTVGAITDGGYALGAAAGGAVSICAGDAGGPSLREVSGGFQLVGVHDGSQQAGCFNSAATQQGASDVRADKLGPWIQQHVAFSPHTVALTRNLARPALFTASSAETQWGWSINQVNDGIRDKNGFSTNSNLGADHTEWLQFEFPGGPNGGPLQVSRVDLYPRLDVPAAQNNFPANFTIAVWVGGPDNGSWETVVTKTNYPKPSTGQRFIFPERVTSKIRITGTGLRYMQFNEVEAYFSKNLAVDATFRASSAETQWGWSIGQVNDFNREQNGFSTNSNLGADHTEWLEFEFPGAARPVNLVGLYPRLDVPAAQNNFPANFTIAVWNGSSPTSGSWENVVTKTNFPKPAAGQRFSFPTRTTFKVRITGTGLRYMQFNEVEAYNNSNLAADATFTASSSAEDWGWSLSQVSDGKRDDLGWSSWSQLETDHDETLTLEFPGGARQVNRVDLYPRLDAPPGAQNFPSRFKIDVWVGSSPTSGSWETVVSKSNWTDVPARLAFPGRSTFKIRITGIGLRLMQFNEVKAFNLTPSPAVAAPANPLPSIVEDFVHPGADQIFAQYYGLRLFRGDGHIVFVTSRPVGGGVQCDSGQIQVDRFLGVDPFGVWDCFRTVGTQGFLALEAHGAFIIRAGNVAVQATAELPTGRQSVTVPANQSSDFFPPEGSDPPSAILVELRIG